MNHDPTVLQATIDENQQIWGVWLWWIFATAIGGAIGHLTVLVIDYSWGTIIYEDSIPREWAIRFAASLLMLSIAQWVVLRLYIPISAWWVFATTIGGGVIFPLIAYIAELAIGVEVEVVAVGIGGVIGIAQWLVFRRHVHKAGRWILVSLVGFLVGIFITPVFSLSKVDWEGILAITVTWTIYGAVTGFTLMRILSDKSLIKMIK